MENDTLKKMHDLDRLEGMALYCLGAMLSNQSVILPNPAAQPSVVQMQADQFAKVAIACAGSLITQLDATQPKE